MRYLYNALRKTERNNNIQLVKGIYEKRNKLLAKLGIVLIVCPAYGMERIAQPTNLERVTIAVSRICSATADPYEALGKVDLMICAQSPHVQLRLLHTLLCVPSFASHIESMLKNIKQIFDTAVLSTLNKDLIVIKMALGKYSSKMFKFICDRFRARYDWITLKVRTLPLPSGEDARCSIPSLTVGLPGLAASEQIQIRDFDAPKARSIKIGTSFGLNSTLGGTQDWAVFEGLQCKKKYEFFTTVEDDKLYYLTFRNGSWLHKGIGIDSFLRTWRTSEISFKFSHNKQLLVIGVTKNESDRHPSSFINAEYLKSLCMYICDLCHNGPLKVFFSITFSRSRDAKNHLADIEIKQIKFSHNDKLLLVCSNYGYVVKEIATGKEVLNSWQEKEDSGDPYRERNIVSCMFSHNDSLFLVCSNLGCTLQNMASKKKILNNWYPGISWTKNSDKSIFSGICAFSHDDILLIIRNLQNLEFFDTRTGAHLFHVDLFKYMGSTPVMTMSISALKFSCDDNSLAFVVGSDLTIFMKDVFEIAFCQQAKANSLKMKETTLQKRKYMNESALAALKSCLSTNKSLRALDFLGKKIDPENFEASELARPLAIYLMWNNNYWKRKINALKESHKNH